MWSWLFEMLEETKGIVIRVREPRTPQSLRAKQTQTEETFNQDDVAHISFTQIIQDESTRPQISTLKTTNL